ncbi:TIGR03545 family protein [uncultured Nitrospira sp.]|uniref:TIGR03545 family protein n=1 Tax=uncultured Nitrospira sp. TaxID=157176 RepID=UPI0031406B7F
MTKWIRWWGLGAFVVFAGILGCVWIFFVDGWVKSLIEGAGTEAVGAKVELDAADLSLFPAGLSLTRLQVTNPKKPMTNAVEVAHVNMGLDGLNLLRRKLIVEEMALEGVRLATPRSTSGVVKPGSDVSAEGEESGMFSLALPALEVPDVKNILEKEDLETIRLIEALKADVEREKEAWEARLKELPGKAQLAEYKERVKSLKKAGKGGLEGVLGGVGEVQALKQDIEQEIESLKGAKKEFEEKVALLRTRLDQVKTAPQRDIQHLKAKYNLSPKGLAHVSQTLLGSRIGSWVHQGAAWYERAKPYLEGAPAGGGDDGPQVHKPLRGKGVDVHFKEVHPLPDFLIRLTKVSVSLGAGDLAGTFHNITTDQPTFGQPTTFAFSGDRLKGVQSVSLEGVLNHVVPADSKDHLMGQVKGYELDNLALSKDDKWPVTLASGVGDVNVNAELKDQGLTVHVTGNFRSLHFSAGKEGDTNPLTKSLSSAVTGVSEFSVQANVTGTLEQHEVTVSSDLDRLLQDAAGKMVNELGAKFGTELQSAISAKMAEPMQQLQSNLSGFEEIAAQLTERVTQHDAVLKSLLEKSLPIKGLKDLPGGLKLPF